jgi:hypothetical protein
MDLLSEWKNPWNPDWHDIPGSTESASPKPAQMSQGTPREGTVRMK